MMASADTVVSAPDSAPRSRPWRRPELWILTGAFVLVEIASNHSGVRSIRTPWEASYGPQVLDPHLLSHHLVQSIWYLHSQPPLYNLQYGILDAMGRSGASSVVLGVFNLALAVLLYAATYLLGLELRLGRWVSGAIAVLMLFSPSFVLYQNFAYSTFNIETTVVVTTLLAARYLRTGRAGYAAGAFWGSALLVLGSSTFQWIFLAGMIGYLAMRRRSWWRRVWRHAVAPSLLVAAWYLKNLMVFGILTTSSWMGMNLAHVTFGATPHAALEHMVAHHQLSSLVLQAPFQSIDDYVAVSPGDVTQERTGVPSLDVVTTKVGTVLKINYNNKSYVGLSSNYLREDLRFIRQHPGTYLGNVFRAAKLWFVPADRYFWLDERHQIKGYANQFDQLVGWEPRLWQTRPIGQTVTPSLANMSMSVLLVYAVFGVGAPLAYLFGRRRLRLPYALVGLMWSVTGYVFVVTTFLDYGENNRFRLDLGAMPLLCAAAIVAACVRALRGRRVVAPGPGDDAMDQPDASSAASRSR